MFRLILGRGGTGKTSLVMERAISDAHQGQRVLLIVPEQFSFEAELQAVSRLEGTENFNFTVLSFSRLAENIFRSCGGLARKKLTDTARLLLMHLAVQETRDAFRVYGRQSRRTSFLSSMIAEVEELKSAGVSPALLRRTMEETEKGLLRDKLSDLAGVYEVYQALIEKNYADPLDDLARSEQTARDSGFFRGAVVYVDGFSFFSPPEREMLLTIASQAEDLTLSLTADGLSVREGGDLFYSQKRTALRLIERLNAMGIACARPVVLEQNRRTEKPGLLAAEEFLAEGLEPPDGAEGVTILNCRDKYEEVRFAAAEISRLVREGRARCRDCVLICRNLEDYETPLRGIFPRWGIPLFYDRRETVQARPLASLISSALDAVSGNWKTEPVLRVSRSPAVGLTMEEASALENYVYLWSIDRDEWTKPFRKNPMGMERRPKEEWQEQLDGLEALRRRVMEPLEHLKQALNPCTGNRFSTAVYQYLEETQALEHLKEHFSGQPEEAQRCSRLWEMIAGLLDLFAECFGEPSCPAAVFRDLFRQALAGMDLGQIPNTRDQVTAGAADRIRLNSPAFVFVLGLNEGVFPGQWKPGGMFTQAEREMLVSRGLEISASKYDSAILERFYLYSAVCAPREQLYLSCAAGDLSGGQLEPSLVFSQLSGFWPQARRHPELEPAEFYAGGLGASCEEYARLYGKGSREEASFRQVLDSAQTGGFLEQMERVGGWKPAENILPQTAKALSGGMLRLSSSQIEEFYQCPYRYFADRMLRLSPRRRVEYTSLELGNAVHYVLEKLFLRHTGAALMGLETKELLAEIQALLEEYVDVSAGEGQEVSEKFRYQFLRLKYDLLLLMEHLRDEFAQSRFSPEGMEVSVGPEGEVRTRPLYTSDGTPVSLSGKIDRVDLFRLSPEETYARVADYKSGGKDFDVEEVRAGLNMQMLFYLFSLCDAPESRFGRVKPAGVLYLSGNIKEQEDNPKPRPAVSGLFLKREEVLEAMDQMLKGDYIPVRKKTTSDEFYQNSLPKLAAEEDFEALKKTVYGNLLGMAEAVRAGKIEPMPVMRENKLPCEYCDYPRLCRNSDGRQHRELAAPAEQQSDG